MKPGEKLNKKTYYELRLYSEQGDDFGECLEKARDNIPKALRNFGRKFLWQIERCMSLAEEIENYINDHPKAKIRAHFGGVFIDFHGPKKFSEKLVKKDLLIKTEYHEEN